MNALIIIPILFDAHAPKRTTHIPHLADFTALRLVEITSKIQIFLNTMNSSTNSTTAPQTLDLLTQSLSLACDMPPADIDTSEHLQLREFLLTACAVVVALTAFQTLKSMVKRVANWKSGRKKGKTKTKVTPRSGEEIDEHIDGHAEKIKEGKGGEIYGMVIHLLQAGLTVYSVVSYWYHYMPNLEGKDIRTHILCRATHMSMMPLFKPVSISMWPALMRLEYAGAYTWQQRLCFGH